MFFTKWKFFRAAKKGDMKKVASLLKIGINPNLKDRTGITALYCASENGHLEVVKLLLENGADIDDFDFSLMIWEGYWEIVKPLIERGANIDFTFLLYEASRAGQLELVKISIEKGVDVNTRNRDGWTALEGASSGGHSDVVKLLVEKGANVNAQDENGQTALHCADGSEPVEEYFYLKVITCLIENGANVNVQDKNGNTPLHKFLNNTSIAGDLKIAKLLIEKGADIEAKNNKDETPFDIARKRFNEKFLKFLKPLDKTQ